MEQLFRFILTRPAQQHDQGDAVAVKPSADYHGSLVRARDARDARAAIRRTASAFASSHVALHTIGDLRYGAALQKLLATLSGKKDLPLRELGEYVRAAFDAPARDVVANGAFAADETRLADCVVTNLLAGKRNDFLGDALYLAHAQPRAH